MRSQDTPCLLQVFWTPRAELFTTADSILVHSIVSLSFRPGFSLQFHFSFCVSVSGGWALRWLFLFDVYKYGILLFL